MPDYTCDRCNKTGTYRGALREYRLATGVKLTTRDQPVWCLRCDSLQPGEWLDCINELNEIVSRLETRGLDANEIQIADFKGIAHSYYLEDRLTYWRVCLHWRSTRKSLPRCLACGSTDVRSLIAPDYDLPMLSFVHPQCGGTFTTDDDFHGMQTLDESLDPEGYIIKGG